MITIKKLKWKNAFSYGEDNIIDFSANPLTQIVGLNGHGKSSIALILEEVLYNKNSKGIKKSDILNRNIDSKQYSIELELEKDGDYYLIKTTRGSTQTVKLYKNGEDISSHTSTATYKAIEELIGYDHKTFSQIVYQSSSASLEFLTATDSNRKKFLIDLLNLTKYVDALEVFKESAKEVNDVVTSISAKVFTAKTWLQKYDKFDFNVPEEKEVPDAPIGLMDQNAELKEQLKNIDSTNKRITTNNKYKELLESIVLDPITVEKPVGIQETKSDIVEHNKTIRDAQNFILKMKKLGFQCATCLQEINQEKVKSIIDEHQNIVDLTNAKLKSAQSILEELEAQETKFNKQTENTKKYEEYHALYDKSISTKLLDKSDLASVIYDNETLIEQVTKEIKEVTEYNSQVKSKAAKVEVIRTQMDEMKADLDRYNEELATATEKQSILQILVKTFSPTGLVAYKIECLIKDLEEVTNKYLGDLSSGRFQLMFKIASDKLNVVITDNGRDIDILALSSGERARVNVSALLGIRALMQSLSNTRINLLILDETVENLDLEGKEKLVEVLLSEEHLNTFLISHGFQHPLLEKIQVIKTNGISRIDNG